MAVDLDGSGEVVKPLEIDGGRSVFAGWPLLIFFAGMLVFTFHACTHMVAAGDTWVAMACGRHHSNHWVDTYEPFSANSHDVGPTEETISKWPGWAQSIAGKFELETVQKWHPTGWVNQNWLTHTTFYQFAKRFGSGGEYNYDGLVYWKFIIFTIEAFCLYFFARLIGVSVPSSAGASAMAMFVGRTFLDIRPACYANVLASIFLLIIALAIYKNYRYIWLIVPLTVFWANVHGGYIYVFLMMVPFIGVFFLANLPKKYAFGLFCMGAWIFMYLRTYKFTKHDTYIQIMKASRINLAEGSMFSDELFRLLALLIIICVVMLILKNLKPAAFYAYCGTASFIMLVLLTIRMLSISLPSNLTPGFIKIAKEFLYNSTISFLFFLAFLLFIGITVSFRKNSIVVIKSKAIAYSVAASIAAFIAMVLFNPYHLTNLTHTFEVSVSKHAESWRSVNEWHPAFDMDNPVGSSYPFKYMFITALVVLGIWSVARFLKAGTTSKRRVRQENSETGMQWPKIDVAIITVAVLSVYMAVASRRFIPIAAGAACPIIALMLEQSVRMILCRINYNTNGKLEMPAIPVMFNYGVIILAVLVTLSFGGFWGAKFKKIYLDPWPNDDIRDSVFMRMTASNVKPFDVCQFMRDNKLSGNMFNYWTEGGALAFGQTPDPETGRTPLQLFQDGRAQAAYSHKDFQTWRHLYSGVLIEKDDDGVIISPDNVRNVARLINDARRANRLIKTGSEDMKLIAEHLNKEMKKRDIWVFVLPTSQFSPNPIPGKVNYFPLALSTHPEWVLVYMDDHQQMYVNKTMGKGKELYAKVLNNQVKFPNKYSENLTLSRVNLRIRNMKQILQGFGHAKKAFEIDQTQASMAEISYSGRYRQLSKAAARYVETFIEDFIKNKEAKSKEGGYVKKLRAGFVGARFLSLHYQKTDPKKSTKYSNYAKSFLSESRTITLEYKW